MNATIYLRNKPAMKTGKKLHSTSIDLRRCARLAACVFLTSLGAMTASHAASFRCPHNASASERIVCADPALSSLDDKLAAVFREAHDATPDASALDADRVTQWQWRQRNCKDTACVTDWYTRRISELQADVAHGKKQTADHIKTGIAEQKLAPSAEAAVLRMKGLGDAASKVSGDVEKAAAPVSKDGSTSAVLGHADIERLRTVPAASLLKAAAASNPALAGNASAPCKGECAKRQVRIAF
ncbi:lipoprotein [Caballeronia temeraria]|uniref:Lipoprotein n=2 Tax=Caballeronia temeraria TaxID=1777137 RepID=A0A158AQS9_9BURK|nr:lipoprotein [Caballeronia temeraria]